MSRKLVKSTVTVGSMTLISRVIGLARDMVFARFGIDAGMDAFFVAFKIPNFMRRLFAEGAFAQAFVPVLSEYKAQREQAEVKALVDRVAGTLAGVLGLLVLVCVLASPAVVLLFAPGFWSDPLKFDLTAYMLRFTFPYLLFMALVAFAAGILNSYGRFAAAAFAPVWLNVVLIGVALLVAPGLEQPVMALSWGVLAAGFVQLAFLLPALRRIHLLPRPRWRPKDPGVRKIMKLMVPGIIGSSVSQINLLLDTLLASFLITGSISWLYYADRLVEFPLGVFGIALSTVLLPRLSRCHAANSPQEFSSLMEWGLRWAVLIALPSATGLFILAGPMITTLFAYDAFSIHDVYMSRLSLMAYALGLPAFIVVKILAPGFFARQDTKTPVKAAVAAMLTNVGFNLLFVGGLLLIAFEGVHMGLALATGIGAYVNAGLLYHWLRRDGVYLPQGQWKNFILQIVFACAVMAAILVVLIGDAMLWYERDFVSRLGWLALWVAGGAMIFALVLWLAGLRPASMAVPEDLPGRKERE